MLVVPVARREDAPGAQDHMAGTRVVASGHLGDEHAFSKSFGRAENYLVPVKPGLLQISCRFAEAVRLLARYVEDRCEDQRQENERDRIRDARRRLTA